MKPMALRMLAIAGEVLAVHSLCASNARQLFMVRSEAPAKAPILSVASA